MQAWSDCGAEGATSMCSSGDHSMVRMPCWCSWWTSTGPVRRPSIRS
jgi:hypothetical protein